MLKYIAFAVIFIVIIFASYKGLQRETQAPTSQIRELDTEVTSTEMSTEAEPETEEKTERVAVSEKKAPAPDPEVEESTLTNKTNDLNEESPKEEDDTPTVKRSQLIGGADVEWIEPKPRSDDDGFGEPPVW